MHTYDHLIPRVLIIESLSASNNICSPPSYIYHLCLPVPGRPSMKITLIVFCLCLIISTGVKAQAAKNLDWGIGLRFGSPSGLDIKHYIHKRAWQLTIGSGLYGVYDPPNGGYRSGYIGFSAMFNFLWRQDFAQVSGLQYYYGFGGLISSRQYYRKDWRTQSLNDRYVTRLGLGATGAVGIEYFIPAAPIALFVELNPYLELIPYPFYTGLGASIGGRFTF